jgi:asparagine synthase (glutamine-hydrolysing)
MGATMPARSGGAPGPGWVRQTMSGICGIYQFDGGVVAARDLDRQMAQLAHLGPDRASAWSEGPIGLGHLMMRITREDMFDAQPLHNGDLSLVADLRLDNREALAAALSIDPQTLAETPDSALLLAAFEKWGGDCVDHLLGDFVFAVWDARRKSLTLGIDHMGQRHVFFHKGDGFFAFAAEIKGLWALPQAPRVLDEARVARMLMFDAPMDVGATDYVGVSALPGGCVLTVNADGEIASRRYWEPHADPAHEGRDEGYYVETYRKVLSEAVECRLRRAMFPAGLFMGGGFDSSAICALAGPVVTAQGRKFIAVSSVMPEDYRGDIRHDARRWCEICRRDMPHLDMRYVTREGLDIFTFMEQGFLSDDSKHGPRRPVTHAMFAEIAAAGARIVMDGHGGDNTLNPRGGKALARMLRKGDLRRFVSEFNATRRHLRQSARQTLVRNVLVPMFQASWLQVWVRRRSGLALFGPTMPLSRQVIKRRDPQARSSSRRRGREGPSDGMQRALRRQQNAPAQTYSISGAAHGLEFTQPFFDKRVVEFGLAIPETLFVKNGRTRHLARTALKDLYPPEFQNRRPGSDNLFPDFLTMAKRVEPRVLAEIDRMEASGRLAAYFDFPRMRAMLTRRTIAQHASGNEIDTGQAIMAFMTARYIEWFRGDNA